MLNLLTDPWLPVIRRHTGRCVIRPAQVVEFHKEDPVIALDWPRPDFRIAALEYLTGLLATAFSPEDSDAWLDFWRHPPRPARLDEVFAPFAFAFVLDGDGPRFLQDFEDLQSDLEPIERLLIEAPGNSTNNKNTDLLVHRDQISSLSRGAAAMALYTLQSWAPAGGAGNRTGLRGGGPLVTIVVPGRASTLWQTLWANVPESGQAPMLDELPLVFPWLAPTVVSAGEAIVTPQSAHQMQCWWGMPRRIRLDFATSTMPKLCDLTGEIDHVQVVAWRQRPRGANYADWGREHPLTPHYQQKAKVEWLPVHPQPDGISYRHWPGLVVASSDGFRLPAASVLKWHNGGRGLNAGVSGARLIAAGYNMDKMKARSFVETEVPLPSTTDKKTQETLDNLAKQLVQSAEQVASLLRLAVRNALYSAGTTIKFDTGLFNALHEQFFDRTEVRFFIILETAAKSMGKASDTERVEWRDHLRKVALALFDETAPLAANSGWTAAARTGDARRMLGVSLAGYGPAGTALLITLALPAVREKVTKRGRDAV